MSKKIEVNLTLTELKIIVSALSMGTGGKVFNNLIEKIEEIIEDNEEPHELTREEWNEKYGRIDD
jgi:hypothetical protein